MKAKIGEQVYTIWEDQIYIEVVEFVGKESFIVEGYGCKIDAEYEYKHYGETWFRDLEKAKKVLTKKIKRLYPKSKFEIVQTDKDLWETHYDDE